MKILYLALALLAISAWGGCGSESKVESEDEKTLYAIGLSIASQGLKGMFNKAEIDVIHRGMKEGMDAELEPEKMAEYGPKIQALVQERSADSTKVGQGESGSGSSARPRATTSKGSRTSGLRVTGAGVELMLRTAPG